MKIIEPQTVSPEGTIQQMPTEFAAIAAPGADIEYRKYDFGSTLRQEFNHPDFQLTITRIIPGKNSNITIQHTKGVALQACLAGSESAETGGLPPKNIIRLKDLNSESFNLETGSTEIEWMECRWNPELNIGGILGLNDPSCENAFANKGASHLCQDVKMNMIMKSLLDRIRNSTNRGARLNHEVAFCVTELFSEYLRACKKVTSSCDCSRMDIVDKIIDEIRTEPNIHHSLKYFMKKYHVSRNALQEAFFSVTYRTIPELIEEESMKMVEFVMFNEVDKLDDLSIQLGYATKSNLMRAYRKYVAKKKKVLKGQIDEIKGENDQEIFRNGGNLHEERVTSLTFLK